jgi:penicillin amidase
VIVCAALILVPLAVAHFVLRASLPKLDGEVHHMGVVAPVTIDRDALGVPTIEAANRVDLAYGLGFVHGQDRFFEMDLSRRLAAGELSEVFGALALEQDKKARLFRFRHVAREALQHANPEEHAVLEAYARGVNAGLASLHSRPWEYWLFRAVPVEWRPEDTMLVSHAMWWDLQYGGIDREILRRQINARMHGPDCENGWKCSLKFLYPLGTEWDAPNAPVGVINAGSVQMRIDSAAAGQRQQVVIPSPDVLDVRGSAAASGAAPVALVPAEAPDRGIGSNNWAVAGRLTATGSALIANDMHLRARVPAVWYRARMRVKAADSQPAIDLNGVTLPGAPLLVAGSNGHIAWGFTNSYGNWFHVEKTACTAGVPVVREQIRVHGKPDVDFPVASGPSGVLYQAEPDGQSCWFVSWLVQQPGATNMNLMFLERTTSVSQALEVAPTLGIPHQNLVVGDSDGHIAWTIAGRIPADTGSSRATGSPNWIGPEAHPRIVDPEIGRIWTANARVTDDPTQQTTIGGVDASIGADYDLAARAHQIREDLLAIKEPATPADMLRIQLDDRAEFLTRWRALLLELLDAGAVASHPERARFKQLVADWNARASVDSVGYRLVRAFHEQTQRSVWEMVLGAVGLRSATPVWAPSQFEGSLWRLVNERPMHMLASSYPDWREFLLSQLDATLSSLRNSCPRLEHCTWGARNPVHIQHPLSRSLPFLSALLDMPALELPGDHDMPRVQDGPIGASERFAVSPGHEDQGYIHIPGGQSGHPLSPYYRAGFSNWAQGVAAPFLPGVALHSLTLESD